MNPHITKNTIVVTKNYVLEHNLRTGTVCRVLRVNRDKQTYLVQTLLDEENYELDHKLVRRIARKHLPITQCLKRLVEKGDLFENYVPVKLCKVQREYFLSLGLIDENNNITKNGLYDITPKAKKEYVKPNYLNMNMYNAKYGENNINEETVKIIHELYE